ncbi:hypothetical protein [Acetobacter sp. UBA5411]|uniref:hypothetical protein n=1 Tax=Acetobacter sp. UBA5411 TaxID=1945905 RepID=UPI0025C3D78F|nr:hypothetical protein [Acetobacter sp. UBA5411]
MSASIPSGYRKVGALRGGRWFPLAKTNSGELVSQQLMNTWRSLRKWDVKIVNDGDTAIYCAKRIG